MAQVPYNPRDPRSRRVNAVRRKLPPGLIRPPAPPRKGFGMLFTRLILAAAVLAGALLMTGGGAAYSAYADLADSLKPRLEQISNHSSFQTTRIYDRHGTLLYEFFGAGHMVFATDMPYDDELGARLYRETIPAVRAMPIAEGERDQILFGNAKRLFRLT